MFEENHWFETQFIVEIIGEKIVKMKILTRSIKENNTIKITKTLKNYWRKKKKTKQTSI